MYHSVATKSAPRFARFVIGPELFAAHMEYLATEGYRPITVLDLVRGRISGSLPPRTVVLTFDDAYSDFGDTVLPILQRHTFPATLFVPTAYVGQTARWLRDCGEDQRPILSWHAIRDIATAGIEVASHSHTHAQLDRIPPELVADELRRSRQLLEDRLGMAIDGLAYPFGYWNRHVRSIASARGYSYACAVGEMTASNPSDAWTLPRMTVAGDLDVNGLAHLVEAKGTAVGRLSSDLKRRAWAAMRRHVHSIGGDPQAASPMDSPLT